MLALIIIFERFLAGLMYLFCPLGYIALTHTHRPTEDILLGLAVTIT